MDVTEDMAAQETILRAEQRLDLSVQLAAMEF